MIYLRNTEFPIEAADSRYCLLCVGLLDFLIFHKEVYYQACKFNRMHKIRNAIERNSCSTHVGMVRGQRVRVVHVYGLKKTYLR